MKFHGVNISYKLLSPSASCYPVSILQGREDKWGSLYVNDSSVLRIPECKEIQYTVQATDRQSRKHAKTLLTIVLEGTRKYPSQLELFTRLMSTRLCISLYTDGISNANESEL